MKRLGTEAEVSAAICFLLSPGAAFITGVTLPIDGGAPLGNALFPDSDHAPSPEFNGFHRAVAPAALSKDTG
jgi:citronellol/citronellal dehydrogenase